MKEFDLYWTVLIYQFKKVQTVEHIQSPWHLYLSPVTIIAISLSFQSARSVVFGHGTSVWRMAAGRARWTNDQWSGGGRERRRSNEAEGSGAEARGVAQPPTTPQIQKHEAGISMRPRTSPYLRLWCHSAELDLLQSQKERGALHARALWPLLRPLRSSRHGTVPLYELVIPTASRVYRTFRNLGY